MKLLIVLFFSPQFNIAFGQVVRPPAYPAWLGLTASSMRVSEPYGSRINPAQLAFTEHAQAGICSEMKFLQQDLRFVFASIAFPAAGGGVAVHADYQGTEGFTQARAGLAYAKKLGSRLALSIGFDLHKLATQGYGSRMALTGMAGMHINVTEKVSVFFTADNPVGGRLGKTSGDKISSIFSAGIGNMISEKVHISSILRKEEASAVSIYFMANYLVHPRCNVFGGISVSDNAGFFGSSLAVKNLVIKQAVSWRQGTGLSPSLSMVFQKEKKE